MQMKRLSPGEGMRSRMPEVPAWLMAESRLVFFRRGKPVFGHQEQLTHVYIVRTGAILIFNIGENGQENAIVTVPEGGVVGEMEAIVGTERIVYSARAFVDSELISIPAEAFMRWVRGDFSACWGLTQVLAEKLYAASSQSSHYTAFNAEDRLALQLLQHGAGRVPYTRQELAEACCASPRTINRCVKKLHAMGLIGLSHGKIEVSAPQLMQLEARIDKNT